MHGARALWSAIYKCPQHPRGGCGRIVITAPGIEGWAFDAVLARLVRYRRSRRAIPTPAATRDELALIAEEHFDALARLARDRREGLITGGDYHAARAVVLRDFEARRRRAVPTWRERAVGDVDKLRVNWPTMTREAKHAVIASELEYGVVHPADPHGPRRFDERRIEPHWW